MKIESAPSRTRGVSTLMSVSGSPDGLGEDPYFSSANLKVTGILALSVAGVAGIAGASKRTTRLLGLAAFGALLFLPKAV